MLIRGLGFDGYNAKKILSDRYNDMGRGESLALTLNLKQYRDVTDLDKTKHLNSGLQRAISTIQIDTTST